MVTMTRSMVGAVGDSGYTLTATEELFLQVTGTTSVILGNRDGTIVEYAPAGGTIPTIKYILVQTPTDDGTQMAEWQFCENGRLIEFLASKKYYKCYYVSFYKGLVDVYDIKLHHFCIWGLYLHNMNTKIIILFSFFFLPFCSVRIIILFSGRILHQVWLSTTGGGGYFHQHRTWMCLLDLENLTFSKPILFA